MSSKPNVNHAQHLLNAVGGTSRNSGVQEDDNFDPNNEGAPNDNPNDNNTPNNDNTFDDNSAPNDSGAIANDGGLNYGQPDNDQFDDGFLDDSVDVDMQDIGFGDNRGMDLDMAVSAVNEHMS